MISEACNVRLMEEGERRGSLVTIILAISFEKEAIPKGGACAISLALYAAVNWRDFEVR